MRLSEEENIDKPGSAFLKSYFPFTSLHAEGFLTIVARQDLALAASGVHAKVPCTPITPTLKGVHAEDLPRFGRPFQTGLRRGPVSTAFRVYCAEYSEDMV